MRHKYLIIILVFYLLSLLQNSFFARLNLFGVIPNFIFIFFFLLIFFQGPQKNLSRPSLNWEIIFYALVAGLFLDFFSYSHFGISSALLIIIGFLAKKMQWLLKEKEDVYPLSYFMPLFMFWLTVYELVNKNFGVEIIYNSLLACLAFYIFKFSFRENGENL